MIRRFFLVALIVASARPASASAQTSADTTAAILAAWDGIVGPAPLDHPAGSTSRVCVDFGALPDSLNAQIATELTGARALEVSYHCSMRLDRSTGDGWIVDDEGEPAVTARLWVLQFLTPLSARVGMMVARGTHDSTTRECWVHRDAEKGWLPEECLTP